MDLEGGLHPEFSLLPFAHLPKLSLGQVSVTGSERWDNG